MRVRIQAGLDALGLAVPDSAADTLAKYGQLLLEQNQVMNLTAIIQPEQVADLHMLDCAALLALGVDWDGKSVVDVGTGAGFPGVVLKILSPSIQLTLLDSLGKRVHWLERLCGALELSGVACVQGRAEELAREGAYRERFDRATARAVAALPVLCELCLPYVKTGGLFIAMKAVDSDPEIEQASAAIQTLGGRIQAVRDYAIPGADLSHRAVLIEKVKPTPARFPRRWARIQKGGIP